MTRSLGARSCVILWSVAAFGQSTANLPSFEVADIKPCKGADSNPGKGRMLPGGRIEVPSTNLKQLIMTAYGVQENMITGGPAWTESDRFDLVAKAPTGTPMETLRLMLQSLLAERFKLAIHHEDRPSPVYALVMGKRPLKLQKASGPGQNCRWQNEGERIQRICQGLTMAELARQLPGWGMARIDRPVVDLTELPGAYDFQLEWSAPRRGEESRAGDDGAGPKAVAPEMSGSTVFEAMQEVGLKLEPRKLPVPVICIDHVERPPDGN